MLKGPYEMLFLASELVGLIIVGRFWRYESLSPSSASASAGTTPLTLRATVVPDGAIALKMADRVKRMVA
jgi:hypothetical protein